MHPVTDKWYGEAEKYEPQHGKEYGWVWDYAKFRFEWACEKNRYIEEKAMTLFKLLLSISVGVGAVFSFLLSHHATFGRASYLVACFALVLLAVSGISVLLAFNPTAHLYPMEEQAAIESIDRKSADQDSRANLSLTLTASTEFERRITSEKSKKLRFGVACAGLSLLLFMLCLFLEVHP